MYNPMLHTWNLQQSMFRNMYCLSQMMAESWLKLLDQNAQSLHGIFGRRGEDKHVPPRILPHGADLMDHYGKRAGDVDVEHDL